VAIHKTLQEIKTLPLIVFVIASEIKFQLSVIASGAKQSSNTKNFKLNSHVKTKTLTVLFCLYYQFMWIATSLTLLAMTGEAWIASSLRSLSLLGGGGGCHCDECGNSSTQSVQHFKIKIVCFVNNGLFLFFLVYKIFIILSIFCYNHRIFLKRFKYAITKDFASV
jgi:hypothetical protein